MNPNLKTEVLQHHAEGMSFQRIAELCHTTRNSVAGIIFRAGLDEYTPAPPRYAQFPPARSCQFIIGNVNGAETHFCGAPTGDVAHPWCPEHWVLVYHQQR